jgi:hypothetical protein
MPLIRYTYPPDVQVHGEAPVLVEELEARVVCDDMRRAVRVTQDELVDLKKADLVEVAEQVGADVSKSAPKAKIAKAVAESEGR